MRIAVAVASLALTLGACVTGGNYKPVAENLPELKVSFADPAWTGGAVPAGKQCSNFGGQDESPSFVVENIPAGANAIIVEYNDLDYGPLSSGGGHGKIGYWHNGGNKAVLPAVPGYSTALPNGAFIEAKALSSGQYASQGYLAPCSGGRGHKYVAEVKAVYKARKEGEENRLLAKQRIVIGTY